jgi:hypothetical protein
MFRSLGSSSSFNQDIGGWDVSSGTDFVSQWFELLLASWWYAHWSDWYMWFPVIPWLSSILLLLCTFHSLICFRVQYPSIKTLVDGMCQMELISWVNDLKFCLIFYDMYIDVISTYDFFVIQWLSSILFLHYTFHRGLCLPVQPPLIKTLVHGMCQVERFS